MTACSTRAWRRWSATSRHSAPGGTAGSTRRWRPRRPNAPRECTPYLRLLRSPIQPTIALAVAALTQVQRAGALDGPRLLAHIAPAMTARAAGTARDALRLVDQAVRRDPSLSAAAARPVAAALAHASVDVQRAVVVMLETTLAPVDDEIAELVAARRGDVAASLRPRLDALLVGCADVPEPPATPEPLADRPEPAAGSASTVGEPSPDVGLVPLVPVRSLPDLVELLAGVLEREGPPEDLELALDGVLRFSGPRPADFGHMTQAIRVRAERLLARRRRSGDRDLVRRAHPIVGRLDADRATTCPLAEPWPAIWLVAWPRSARWPPGFGPGRSSPCRPMSAGGSSPASSSPG